MARKKDNSLLGRIRSLRDGRKSTGKQVTDGVRSAFGTIQDRVKGGPQKRSAAARKGARTRRRGRKQA
ncbi:MAG TPA: hypothetical protein VKA89_01320 [Solirubrobacterales bacterium]|nr:hypothetical protein [Solirubrobacterales bacterium]